MARVSTYLNFPRTTEAAFDFYRAVFQTDYLGPIARFRDMPAAPGQPPLAAEDENLVNLPAGKYRIAADYNGATRWRTVSVGGSHHDRVTFTWPSEYGSERATSGGAEFSAFEISEPRRTQACS